MYKTIISELVSFDTQAIKLRGCGISTHFESLPLTEERLRFHYRIRAVRQPPTARPSAGGVFVEGSTLRYVRRVIGGKVFGSTYAPHSKLLTYAPCLTFLPDFFCGRQPGSLIEDIMRIDLFLAGIIVIPDGAYDVHTRRIYTSHPTRMPVIPSGSAEKIIAAALPDISSSWAAGYLRLIGKADAIELYRQQHIKTLSEA